MTIDEDIIGLCAFSKEINSKWISEIRDFVLETLYEKKSVIKISAGYTTVGKSGSINMDILINSSDKDVLISEIKNKFPFFNAFEEEKVFLNE